MATTSTSSSHQPGTIYFHRPQEKPYGIFSQWYKSHFVVDGERYISAEMWMMVQKAKLFGDEYIAREMMKTTDPKEHQRLGRQAKGFTNEKWDAHKSSIVIEGNYHKFTKGPNSKALAKILLDTGDSELVEAAPKDRIWGIGFGARYAEQFRKQWGQNLLGLALMEVRRRLREEAANTGSQGTMFKKEAVKPERKGPLFKDDDFPSL